MTLILAAAVAETERLVWLVLPVSLLATSVVEDVGEETDVLPWLALPLSLLTTLELAAADAETDRLV